jgi:hypothetical protein
MLSAHYRSVKAVMDLRVADALQDAESRALLRQATIQPRTWLPQQGCWLLCQLGHLLVALGRRLEQYGGLQPLSLNGGLGRSS